jgi:hypothetical protein
LLFDSFFVEALERIALLTQPVLYACDLINASDCAAGNIGELGIDVRSGSRGDLFRRFR